MAIPIIDHNHPKIIELTFNFPEFAPSCKKINLLHLFILERQSISDSHDHTSHSFLTLPNQKCFWSTYNLCEFAPICNKSGCFIDLFWRYDWLKNPAIWLDENILVHISGKNFPQIWDLHGKTVNNINFYYRTKQVKLNDQLFQQIQKKPYFSPFLVHFPNFGGKKKFSWKPDSAMHNSIWVSSAI